MEYLSRLTIAEKETLCDIITGAEFKKLFIANEQEFQRMRGGFRAKALSESLALSIAKAYVNHPFITSLINDLVNDTLQKITENILRFPDFALSLQHLCCILTDDFSRNKHRLK